jgi:cold shock CspA family protein
MGKDPEEKESEEQTTAPAREEKEPADSFYHGVITKIFSSNNTGVIRSDTGKEVPFTFVFVTLIGAPRHDIRYLHEGMRVGFDVGWTSKGLRATVIKIYEDS